MKEYVFNVIIDNKKDIVVNYAKSVWTAIDNVLQMPMVQDFTSVKITETDAVFDLMDFDIEDARDARKSMTNLKAFVALLDELPDTPIDLTDASKASIH